MSSKLHRSAVRLAALASVSLLSLPGLAQAANEPTAAARPQALLGLGGTPAPAAKPKPTAVAEAKPMPLPEPVEAAPRAANQGAIRPSSSVSAFSAAPAPSYGLLAGAAPVVPAGSFGSVR